MSIAAVAAPTSEPSEAHGDASTASRALNETLEEISASLRQITRPWSNPQAQGGMFRAVLENRVVRETEHFASLLDERVTDVVQGYKKLHELTATGPELVRKAAASVVEGLGGQFERSEHKTITEIARAYDATYEELREVQQERIAMSRVLHMPVSLYHLPARLDSAPVPQAPAGPARRARMGLASTRATVSKAAERASAPTEPTVPRAPIATDQPLSIPRYPSSFVGPTPPTAPPRFWPAGEAVHAPSAETKGIGTATALQQQQHIKVKQGYGLPPEVQAALLLMPKPESHLYKAAPNVSFTRLRPKGQDTSFSSSRGRIPRSAPSPRRIRLEDLAPIERLDRVMDALRERLADLEKQGGSSAAVVAALQALMKELAEKYKDLEGGLAAVSRRMDDIPLMAPSVAAPKPPQPPPPPISTPAPREPVAPEPSSPAMYRVLPVRTKTTKEVVQHETPIQIVDIVLGANMARLEVGGWAHAGAKEEKGLTQEVEDNAEGAPVVLHGQGRLLEDELGDLTWNADVKQQWKGWPQEVPHEEPQQKAEPAAPQMTVDEVVERILKALGTPPEAVTVDDKPSPAPASVSAPIEDEDARRIREGREMAEEERRMRMADEAARERERLREREHEEREARLAALRALSEARERAVDDAEAERRRAADREAAHRAQAQLLRSLVEDLLKRVTAVESRPVVQETAPQPPPPPPPPAPAVEPPQLVTRGIQVSQPVVPPPPPPRPPSPAPTPSQPYAPTPPRIPRVDRLPAVWLETLSDESSLSSSSLSASLPSPPQRRQHLSPPSLSPSGSEGQIFLDAEADDVSQGQLVRKYRLARYRATKVAVAQAVREVEAVTRWTLRPAQGGEKQNVGEDGEEAVVAGPGDDDALRVGTDHVRVFERAHAGFEVGLSDTEEEQGTDADESRDEADHARQARRTAEHVGLFTGPPGVGQGMRLLQWRRSSDT